MTINNLYFPQSACKEKKKDIAPGHEVEDGIFINAWIFFALQFSVADSKTKKKYTYVVICIYNYIYNLYQLVKNWSTSLFFKLKTLLFRSSFNFISFFHKFQFSFHFKPWGHPSFKGQLNLKTIPWKVK